MNAQFKKWDINEEHQLLREVADKIPIYGIAKIHNRSKKAIEIRLQDIGIRMLSNGFTYDDIMNKTYMSEEQLKLRMMQKEQEKSQNNKTNNNDSNVLEEIKTNVITILDTLKEMSENLHKIHNTQEIC